MIWFCVVNGLTSLISAFICLFNYRLKAHIKFLCLQIRFEYRVCHCFNSSCTVLPKLWIDCSFFNLAWNENGSFRWLSRAFLPLLRSVNFRTLKSKRLYEVSFLFCLLPQVFCWSNLLWIRQYLFVDPKNIPNITRGLYTSRTVCKSDEFTAKVLLHDCTGIQQSFCRTDGHSNWLIVVSLQIVEPKE